MQDPLFLIGGMTGGPAWGVDSLVAAARTPAGFAAKLLLGLLAHEEFDKKPDPCPSRTLKDPLPKNSKKPTQADPHSPDPNASGPHTVIGTRTDPKQSPEPYLQGITYDADGNPIGRIDVSDHGRGDHDDPHYHPYDPNIQNPFDPENPGNFGAAQPMPELPQPNLGGDEQTK